MLVLNSVASDAAVVLLCIALTIGTMFLITWIYAPIAEAKRLAQETDPAQEATFLDPQDDKKRYVGF